MKHFTSLLKYKDLLFGFSFKIVENDPSPGSSSGTMTLTFFETECFSFYTYSSLNNNNKIQFMHT